MTPISKPRLLIEKAPPRGRTTSAGGGDCDFPVDPQTPAPEAPVFWLPHEDTSIVVLSKVPWEPGDSEEPGATEIWRDRNPLEFVEADYRFALGNGQYLQLHDCGIGGREITVAVVPLGLEGLARIEAIRRFLSALHGRMVPPDTRLTRQRRARLRRMLRAFDGHRAGATQQEIAQVILRVGGMDRDEWQASAARHAIKALLRDARSMVAGGYRKLLRHRRRY